MKSVERLASIAVCLGAVLFVASFFLPTPAAAHIEPANGFGMFFYAALAALNSPFLLLALFESPSWEGTAILIAALSVLCNFPTTLLILQALFNDSERIRGLATWQLFSAGHAATIGFLPPFNPLELGAPYLAWVVAIWVVACYAMLYEFIRWRALIPGLVRKCRLSPSGGADGSNAVGIRGESIPCVPCGVVQGGVVGVGAIREIVTLEVKPRRLHRVQLGRIRRQRHQVDVVRHAQGLAAVPTGVVEHQGHLHVRRDRAADLRQVEIHAEGIAGRHDPADRSARGGTGGSEQIHPFVLGLTQAARACAARGPDMRQRALLPEAALVLEPDFDAFGGVRFLDFDQHLRELFLYVSCAARSVLTCSGRGVT